MDAYCYALFNQCLFFFNDPATTEIYTLSLHDALPISSRGQLSLGAPPLPGIGIYTCLQVGRVPPAFGGRVDDAAAGGTRPTLGCPAPSRGGGRIVGPFDHKLNQLSEPGRPRPRSGVHNASHLNHPPGSHITPLPTIMQTIKTLTGTKSWKSTNTIPTT